MARRKKTIFNRKCCVNTCKCSQLTCKCYYIPQNGQMLKIWTDVLQPQCKTKLNKFKVVCQHHFEDKYITKKGSRNVFSIPTLFSSEEISSKTPLTPLKNVKFYKFTEHNYYKEQKHHDHTYFEPEPLIQIPPGYDFVDIPPSRTNGHDTSEHSVQVQALYQTDIPPSSTNADTSKHSLSVQTLYQTDLSVPSTDKNITEDVIEKNIDLLQSSAIDPTHLESNGCSMHSANTGDTMQLESYDDAIQLEGYDDALQLEGYDDAVQLENADNTVQLQSYSYPEQLESYGNPVYIITTSDGDLMQLNSCDESAKLDSYSETVQLASYGVPGQSVYYGVLIPTQAESDHPVQSESHCDPIQSISDCDPVQQHNNGHSKQSETKKTEFDGPVWRSKKIRLKPRFCIKRKALSPRSKKIHKYKNLPKHTTKAVRTQIDKYYFENITKSMNPLAKQFVWMQIQKSATKGSLRFNEKEKMASICIMKQSTKCYEFLRSIFILPSAKTLKKYIAKLKTDGS